MVLACIAAPLSAEWIYDQASGGFVNTETGEWSERPGSDFFNPRLRDPEIDSIRADVEDEFRRYAYGESIEDRMALVRRRSPLAEAGWTSPVLFEGPYYEGFERQLEYPDPRAIFREQEILAAQVRAAQVRAGQKADKRVFKVEQEAQKRLEAFYAHAARERKKAEEIAQKRIAMLEAELAKIKQEKASASSEALATVRTAISKHKAEEEERALETARELQEALSLVTESQLLAKENAKLVKEKEDAEALRLERKLQKVIEKHKQLGKELLALEDQKTEDAKATAAKTAPKGSRGSLESVRSDDSTSTASSPEALEDTHVEQDAEAPEITQDDTLTKIKRAVKVLVAGQREREILEQVKNLYDSPADEKDLTERLRAIFVHNDSTKEKSKVHIGLMYSFVKTFEELQKEAETELAGLSDDAADARARIQKRQARYKIAQEVLKQRRQQEAKDAEERYKKAKEAYNKFIENTDYDQKKAEALRWKKHAFKAEKRMFKGTKRYIKGSKQRDYESSTASATSPRRSPPASPRSDLSTSKVAVELRAPGGDPSLEPAAAPASPAPGSGAAAAVPRAPSSVPGSRAATPSPVAASGAPTPSPVSRPGAAAASPVSRSRTASSASRTRA